MGQRSRRDPTFPPWSVTHSNKSLLRFRLGFVTSLFFPNSSFPNSLQHWSHLIYTPAGEPDRLAVKDVHTASLPERTCWKESRPLTVNITWRTVCTCCFRNQTWALGLTGFSRTNHYCATLRWTGQTFQQLPGANKRQGNWVFHAFPGCAETRWEQELQGWCFFVLLPSLEIFLF